MEVVNSVMPILDKDKPTTNDTSKTTPLPSIFVVPPPPQPVPEPETPTETPTQSTSTEADSEKDFNLYDPTSIELLTDTIKKLREKHLKQEETLKNLRNANDQHVKDKNAMKRELFEERGKVAKLLRRDITDAEKRKVCEDLLKPYMGDTAAKCFIDGKDGEFAKVGKWTRDEIIFGITLRTISRKAYNFLRLKKIYPLPAESTLKAQYADFQLTEGKFFIAFLYLFLQLVVRVLKRKVHPNDSFSS